MEQDKSTEVGSLKNRINSYFTKEKRENFSEKVKSNFHNYIILYISIAIFVLSWFWVKKFWIYLIDKFLVNPVISKLLGNLTVPAIILLSLIILYYIIVWKNEKKYSPKRFLLISIITAIYGLCFFSDNWYFYTPVEGSKILSYSNIIFIPFILEFFFWLIRLCNGRKNIIDTSNQLELELICKEEKDDHFKRSDYIISISKILRNSFYEVSSFAIGINGSWGSGKSSFVEILKQKIEEQNIDKQKIVVIDYHPWNCKDPNDIIEDFFSMYRSKITIHIPELSPLIRKYSNALLDISSSKSSKFISSCIDLLNNDDTQSQYDKITNILKKSKLNVIITIDDLDRLDKNEIMEVLRLIRNSANFPYTQFIVAYDKDYVVETLKNNNIQKAEQYLEKIFNLEISLPKYQEKIICEELSKRIFKIYQQTDQETNISKEQIDELVYKRIDENDEGQNEIENINYLIPKIIKTKRDVIRFSNSFRLNFQPFVEIIKGKQMYKEINLEDFFFVELLRYGFPKAYNILKDNPSLILNLYYGDYTYSYRIGAKDTENKLSELSNNDTDSLEIIINKLFGSYIKQKNDTTKILHLRSFYKYFSFQLDERCITNEEFISIIKKEDAKNIIEEWYKLKYKKEIENRLIFCIYLFSKEIDIKDIILPYKDVYSLITSLLSTEEIGLREEVIDAISYNINYLNDINFEQYTLFIQLWTNALQYEKHKSKLYCINILEDILIKEKIKKRKVNVYEEEMYIKIDELFSNCESSGLLTELITEFINKYYGYDEILVISTERLKEIQVNYLKKYLSTTNEIDEKCLALFKNSVDKISNKKYINDDLYKLMRDKIRKNPNGYIKNFIGIEASGPDWINCIPNYHYENIFGSKENLENFLLSKDLDNIEKIKQARDFWQLYKYNGYKRVNLNKKEPREDLDNKIKDLDRILTINKEIDNISEEIDNQNSETSILKEKLNLMSEGQKDIKLDIELNRNISAKIKILNNRLR